MNACCEDIHVFVLSEGFDVEDACKKHNLNPKIKFLHFQENDKLIHDYIVKEGIDFAVIEKDTYDKYITKYPLLERCFDSPFIILNLYVDVEDIVRYMKKGAVNYLVAPISDAKVLESIDAMVKGFPSLLCFCGGHSKNTAFSHIITQNKSMEKLFNYAEAIAKTDVAVLITGETGTGKEEMAKAIHKASGRKGEFVAVNVAGLDDKLFADTLFGHVKGAFTGAMQTRVGLISKAVGGTLFLDEIGDLKIEGQLKLLRLLQEKEYYPLGADEFLKTDTRIVLATNCNLAELVERGVFRKDLYFRLKAHEIKLPPLSKRKGDIPFLIRYFMKKACSILGYRKELFLPDEIYTILSNYDFPGNIRELELMITDSIVVSKGNVLTLEVIKDRIFKSRDVTEKIDKRNDLAQMLEDIEFLPSLKYTNLLFVKEALKRTNNNKTQAAGLIGVTRQTIDRYLKEQ